MAVARSSSSTPVGSRLGRIAAAATRLTRCARAAAVTDALHDRVLLETLEQRILLSSDILPLESTTALTPPAAIDFLLRQNPVTSTIVAPAGGPEPPVANAGADRTLTRSLLAGRAIQLDATGSIDPDDSALAYRWVGPFGQSVLATPTVQVQEGQYLVTLVASDGRSQATDTATIEVKPGFQVQARAKPGLAQLTWSPPAGASFYEIYRADAATPQNLTRIDTTTSSYAVYIDEGLVNEKTYLYVVAANTPTGPVFSNVVAAHPTQTRGRVNWDPVIYSTAITTAVEGFAYRYDANAVDANLGDALVFSLANAPSGMTIDPSTGRIDWVPVAPGSSDVRVRVSDGKGGTAEQAFVITTEALREFNRTPVAAIASIGSVTIGVPLALDGTGSTDPDGDTLSYAWGIVAAPTGSTASLSGSTNVTAGFTADLAGFYSITLTVSDGEYDSVAGLGFTAVAVNRPPIADAGADTSAFIGRTVTLDGSASRDPDGVPVSQSWTILTRPAGSAATLLAASTATPRLVLDKAGRYELRLVVSDGALQDDDTVVVDAINRLPIANAGVDRTVGLGASVTVSGAASSDPDGFPLTYAWTLFSRPAGSTATLADVSASDRSFVADLAGDYELRLVVNDGTADSVVDSVIVTALAAANDPPIAEAGAGRSVDVGSTVTLDGSQSRDPEGVALSYAWTLVGKPPGSAAALIGADQVAPRFVADRAGSYTIDLVVSDGVFTSTVDSIVITTNNRAPIADAGADIEGFVGGTVTLDGSASADPDGPEPGLTWSVISRPSGSTALPIPADGERPIVVLDKAGSYSFRLVASDGQFTDDDEVVVTTRNRAPSADAGPDRAVATGGTATVSVAASDPDDDPLTIFWSLTPPAGSTAALSDTAAVAPSFVADLDGAYTLVVTIGDGTTTATDTIIITAAAALAAVVPNVLGMTEAEARAAILAAGMQVGVVELRSNDTYLANRVYDQTPDSGTTGDGTTTVALFVSTGPRLLPVPNVVGMTEADAVAALVAAQFGIGERTHVSSAVEAGDVISQAVAAGTQLPKGSLIDFAVSLGQALALTADTIKPVVTLSAPAALATGATTTIQVRSPEAGMTLGLKINGEAKTLTGAGDFVFSSPIVGYFTLVATATDAAGNVGETTRNLLVGQTGDTVLPTVAITAPAAEAKLVQPVAVTGTASDNVRLLRYELAYRLQGEAEFVTFKTSDAPIVGGTLGTFDPTQLRNGIYDLRLVAIDASNNRAETSIEVEVEAQAKVGNFTIAFTDMSVPVVGIPISVTRTYDSRDKSVGDFGVGWQLDVNAIKLTESDDFTDGWQQVPLPTGPFRLTQYHLRGTETHTVTISFGDGRVDRFTVSTPSVNNLFELENATMVFTADERTFSKLEPLDQSTSVAVDGTLLGRRVIDEDTGLPDFIAGWNPNRYKLTDRDGTVYIMQQVNRPNGTVDTVLESITDLNGNVVTFTESGVNHSAGKSITYTRDGQGRITRITDPVGNFVSYEYDSYGDLVKVTDPVGNVTRFTYDSRHNLVDIIDPRGLKPARNEYDDQGRLIATIDAYGKRVEFTHSPGVRTETVTDRLGNIRIYEYDARGNVTREQDAVGGVVERVYQPSGPGIDNLLEERVLVSPGVFRVTTYEYDAVNNRTKETDPLGNVTRYTYNARNQLLTVVDALGRTTSNVYDASGNLTQTTDTLGNVTRYAYNARGLQTGMTDALGNVTTYEYDASGNLTRQVDPWGLVTTYAYDANGNRTRETRRRSFDGAPQDIVTQFVYDAANRLVRTVHPDGSETRSVYNAIGQQEKTIDGLGRETLNFYDAAGRLVRTTMPDGTETSSFYDAEGRRVRSADQLGRITSYVYDAVGRLVRTNFADGAFTTTDYDIAGQVVSTTDERGNVTRYEYDLAGRRIRVIDALGNATRFTYDALGNQENIVDALGRTTRFVYDALNRRIETVYADGTKDKVGYDALGRQVSKTDQAGVVTRYEYDSGGRLTKVIDALGGVTVYGYDEVGNFVTQTDARGNTTRFRYDEMGRRISRQLPLLMTETMVYDAVGNMRSHTDFNGRTTTFLYDAMNRLVKRTPDAFFVDEVPDEFGYTATGQRAFMKDGTGTTLYVYDVRDRLLAKTTPFGTLIYTYDAGGNVASIVSSNAGGTDVSYGWDELNRLETVTDNRLVSGTTTYQYNADGTLREMLYPNGVKHAYAYDGLGRLVDLVVTSGGGATTIASYRYTLGLTGNRTKVVEFGGRTVEWEYDALYRLTEETISGDAVGPNGVIGYTYDAVGNRLTRTSTVAGVDSDRTAYDANDRVASSTHDNNGNMFVAANWKFDSKNNLIGNGFSFKFIYDADSIRVGTQDLASRRSVLIDTKNPTRLSQAVDEIENGLVSLASTFGTSSISERSPWNVSYFILDGLRNVRVYANASGGVTGQRSTDAFGVLIGDLSQQYQRGFLAEKVDHNTNFIDLRSRDYNYQSGRFSSMDSHSGFPLLPLTLNKFLYADGDPTNKMDPTGLFALLIAEAPMLHIRSTLSQVQADIGRDLISRASATVSHHNSRISSGWEKVEFVLNAFDIVRLLSAFMPGHGSVDIAPISHSYSPARATWLQRFSSEIARTASMSAPAARSNILGLYFIESGNQFPEIERIIKDHYRPMATIGSGSSSDALRAFVSHVLDKKTKPPFGSHGQKIWQDLQTIGRLIQSHGKELSDADRLILEWLKYDMTDAFGYAVRNMKEVNGIVPRFLANAE